MRRKKQSAALLNSPFLITDKVPFEYEEAYKAMRTNFDFVTSKGKVRKIIVTSSLPDEGKSTVAINLAISLAQADNRVLLIDADLRKPVLRRYLRLKNDNKKGLSTLLNGDAKVGDCLIKTEYGVDVIANGPTPPNPTELIQSDAMRSLLREAAENYDYIICDTSPVGVITDAAALSPLCDGVLYVIRQKYANKSQVRNAIKKLYAVDAKILGTVLCQYEISKHLGKRYSYYHAYRYKVE